MRKLIPKGTTAAAPGAAPDDDHHGGHVSEDRTAFDDLAPDIKNLAAGLAADLRQAVDRAKAEVVREILADLKVQKAIYRAGLRAMPTPTSTSSHSSTEPSQRSAPDPVVAAPSAIEKPPRLDRRKVLTASPDTLAFEPEHSSEFQTLFQNLGFSRIMDLLDLDVGNRFQLRSLLTTRYNEENQALIVAALQRAGIPIDQKISNQAMQPWIVAFRREEMSIPVQSHSLPTSASTTSTPASGETAAATEAAS